MDLLSLQKSIDKLNDETLPKVEALITRLEGLVKGDINQILDRISGTRLTIAIPPEGSKEC